MVRVIFGAIILTAFMVQSAEACRHRRCGGCYTPPAPCCHSVPAVDAPAPPVAPDAQARDLRGTRQFSFEPGLASDAFVAPAGVYEMNAPIGARRITESGGVRRASSKVFGNY